MPTTDLATGLWFWRVASDGASPPGPLWQFVVRSGSGRGSRVHGIDLNGDGFADVPLDAAALFGTQGGRFARAFTPVPYAELDSPTASPVPAPIRRLMVRLIEPVGDVDGDGFDDAILDKRVLLGGASGIAPPAKWLACPASGCGDPAGDIDGDGFADLFTKDALLFGSPGGFRVTPSTLLSGAALVRRASDVDGDGISDLVALSTDRRTLSVFRGSTGGPTLGSKAAVELPAESAADVDLAIGDVDGDGASDIVLLTAEREIGKRQRLRITVTARLTARGGEIANAKELRVSWTVDAAGGAEDASANVSVADVDGDGRDDLVVLVSAPQAGHARLIHADGAALRLDPRSLAFGARNGSSVSAVISAGDVDGDGRDDVVLVGNDDTGLVQMIDLFAGTRYGLAQKPSAGFVFTASDRVPQARK